jgi:hypothetical protein
MAHLFDAAPHRRETENHEILTLSHVVGVSTVCLGDMGSMNLSKDKIFFDSNCVQSEIIMTDVLARQQPVSCSLKLN